MNKHRVGQTKWKKDRGELRDLEIPGAPVSRENYEAITTRRFMDNFNAEPQKYTCNFTFINLLQLIMFFPVYVLCCDFEAKWRKTKKVPEWDIIYPLASYSSWEEHLLEH